MKQPKPYTAAELRKFDRITAKLGSRSQIERISGRLEIKKFIAEHGQTKCDAMFVVLKKRDRRR